MSRKQFTVCYPDRSRHHVSRTERDQLLLAGLIKLKRGLEYDWRGQVQTLHSFADLAKLQSHSSEQLRRFLEGKFTIELAGKRHSERLETPEAMAVRLEQSGQLVGAMPDSHG
jgi:hypothetical protein